jgi:hypothetical protein
MATAMGICNFFGRMTAMMAPLVAEIEAPVPMIFMGCFCAVAFLVTLLINEDKGKVKEEDEFTRIN